MFSIVQGPRCSMAAISITIRSSCSAYNNIIIFVFRNFLDFAIYLYLDMHY